VRVIVGREEEEEEEEEMETMEELLSGHPFFAGLDADALRLMAGCASNAHFAAGEFIFCEGEAAHRFYLIRAGRVSLEIHSPTRGPVIIDTMDEGEVLGWSWLIPPYRFFGDARAVTPVSAIALDGACLRGKCEADAQLGYQLLKRVTAVMYQRLESARVRLLDLYGPVPALSRPRLGRAWRAGNVVGDPGVHGVLALHPGRSDGQRGHGVPLCHTCSLRAARRLR
jgi:CRP/FNR family transcriptional regulator, cyclic AMP receptor protein